MAMNISKGVLPVAIIPLMVKVGQIGLCRELEKDLKNKNSKHTPNMPIIHHN